MIHNIVRGDTLSDIALLFQTTVERLMSLNDQIQNRDLIFAGDTLRLDGLSEGRGDGRIDTDNRVDTDTRVDTGRGNAADIAKRFLGRDASDLKRSGEIPMNPNVPSDVCCANFVTACLQKAGAIDWHTDSVVNLRDRLIGEGWKRVDVSQAKPGDVVIMQNARQSHTVLFAGLDANGKPQFIGSNNRNADGTQEISWGGASGDWYILSRPR
ncbi:LysM peptidoglycan-binding domain-containing protein [Lysobacter antibioticus]|uniref:LysM peptidoglycan-binding domain-containing protein n=1 Tax=Lysobacter antibioticus TaxID=84531 RepID=UPI00034C99DA|nr:LysM domain-containing protein [Lysobacter antibioticus]